MVMRVHYDYIRKVLGGSIIRIESENEQWIVKAVLFASKLEGPVPLTVDFTTYGEAEDTDPGSPTYGQMIPVSSVGTEMILTIGWQH